MARYVEEAMEALRHPGWPIAEAMERTPNKRGLYAIHASRVALVLLGLPEHDPREPIYVGKAAKSLMARDTHDHFTSGRTGWSTLRRSCAALLTHQMSFIPTPRSPGCRRDKWNLESDHQEELLTAWMETHLTLAVWECPAGTDLAATEVAIIKAWCPPLNQVHNPEKWSHLLECLEEMRSRVDRSRRQNVSPT